VKIIYLIEIVTIYGPNASVNGDCKGWLFCPHMNSRQLSL